MSAIGGIASYRGPAARIIAIPFAAALASLVCACIARFAPMPPVEAVTLAMILSFPLCTILVITAFSMRNIMRFWAMMVGIALPLGGALAWSIATAGRL